MFFFAAPQKMAKRARLQRLGSGPSTSALQHEAEGEQQSLGRFQGGPSVGFQCFFHSVFVVDTEL